jgi:RNA polymerase sigma factor (sigma-70 family)
MEINRIQTSEKSALTIEMDWREVYDQLLPRVFHFFYYKVGDVHIAEELTATTFEKVWKSREKYHSQLGAYRFYIFGIAQKVAADYFRKPRPEVGLEEAYNLPEPQCVEEQAERHFDFQRLAKLVERLTERERSVISLKYGAEMTNREIAKLTNLSESNVGTILYRAVLKLRQEWEKME